MSDSRSIVKASVEAAWKKLGPGADSRGPGFAAAVAWELRPAVEALGIPLYDYTTSPAPTSSPEAGGEDGERIEEIRESHAKYGDLVATKARDLLAILDKRAASLTQARSTIAGLQDAGNRMLARKDAEIASLRAHAEAVAGALSLAIQWLDRLDFMKSPTISRAADMGEMKEVLAAYRGVLPEESGT